MVRHSRVRKGHDTVILLDAARSCVRTFVIVLLACGLARSTTAAPVPASGDDAKAKAQASGLLGEARKLYDQGEYGGALDRLNQAYATFPSPVIHFNFGQVYRALLREVEALESFELFLDGGTDQDPKLRREAEIFLLDLSRRVGTLEIRADTEGALVSVDGKPRGKTPLVRPIRVAPGAHQVLVQGRNAAVPFVRQVQIGPGELARVEALLAPKPTAPIAAPTTLAATPPAPPTRDRPFYKNWWFWTTMGALVAGAIVTTVLVSNTNTKDTCAYNAGCVAVP